MTTTNIQQRSISFATAKSKFLNSTLQADSSSNESIDTLDKKFKYEVKLPSAIHTTTRKNKVGGGLNELNLKKEANSAVSKPNAVKKKKVTFANPEYHIIPNNVTEHQPTLTEYMLQKERDVKKANPFKRIRETLPVYENVDAFDDETIPAWEDVDTLDNAFERDNQNARIYGNITSGTKPYSAERDNQNTRIYGNITSGTKPYSATERCMVTHDGSALKAKMERKHGFQSDPSIKHTSATERCMVTHDGSALKAKMERKHGFQSDPSIKHIKVDTAVCSITKGSNKKDVRADTSYKQEPLSEVFKVDVKELASRFRG